MTNMSNRTDIKIKTKIQMKEKNFVTDFVTLWENVGKLIKSEYKRSSDFNKILKKFYNEYTISFYKKWYKNDEHVGKLTEYSKHFYSFPVIYDNFNLFVPSFMFAYSIFSPDKKITNRLKQFSTYSELFDYLKIKLGTQNLLLSELDIKILQYYTNSEFHKGYRFPIQKDIAKDLNCHVVTLTRRLKRLRLANILSGTYKVDHGKLGFQTLVYINKKRVKEEMVENQAASVPLDFGMKNGNLMIYKIPYYDHQAFNNLEEKYSPINILKQSLTNEYIGWNLSTLTSSIENRWQVLPPIISKHSWTDKIIGETKGLSLNLIPEAFPPKILETRRSLVSFFEQSGTIRDKRLAKDLNMDLTTLENSWNDITKKDRLIYPFPIVQNIGLDIKPWITLISPLKTTEEQLDIFKNILEHLKFLPFNYLFNNVINNEKEQLNQRLILTGLIYLPNTWMIEFVNKWNELAKYGFYPKINFGTVRDIKWNMNI